MAGLAIRPHVVEFFDVARTAQPGLRQEELQITEGSALAGRSLNWRYMTADIRSSGGTPTAGPLADKVGR